MLEVSNRIFFLENHDGVFWVDGFLRFVSQITFKNDRTYTDFLFCFRLLIYSVIGLQGSNMDFALLSRPAPRFEIF